MKLHKTIQFFSQLLVLYSLVFGYVPSDDCPPGEYNDGGQCTKCVPCPKHDLNSWLEPKCRTDNVNCPELCRLPDQEWEEEAGPDICDHQTTPAPEDIDQCKSNPCHNGAVCVNGVSGYNCTCQPGWSGPKCDESSPSNSRYSESVKPDIANPTNRPIKTIKSGSPSTSRYSGSVKPDIANPSNRPIKTNTSEWINIGTFSGVVLIILLVGALFFAMYHWSTTKKKSTLNLAAAPSNTSFAISVKLVDEKCSLVIFREGKHVNTQPIERSGDYPFGPDMTLPNCQYKIFLIDRDLDQKVMTDIEAMAFPSLSFKTPGMEIIFTSTKSSITLFFSDREFPIYSIVGCSCINEGKPVVVTGRESYTIDGLQSGCDYPVALTTHVTDSEGFSVIEIGRQHIATCESADVFSRVCTATARTILDLPEFQPELGALLTLPNKDPHVIQLRQNLLRQARACYASCASLNACSSVNEDDGRFPDKWLQVLSGDEFVEGYDIQLQEYTMQRLSVKDVFIDGVIGQSNKNLLPFKEFVNLLLQYHPQCLCCLVDIHKKMHEELGVTGSTSLVDNSFNNDDSSITYSESSCQSLIES